MLPDPSPETWIQIRYEYEHTEKPVDDICLDHGVSPSTLRERMRRWRWTRRRQPISAEGPPPMPPPIAHAAPLAPFVGPAGAAARPDAGRSDTAAAAPEPCGAPRDEPPGDPAAIVPRLQGAVARVLPAIEATVGKIAAGPMPPREMERAARALSSLTRTLRELNGLLSEYQARGACACDCDMPEDIDAFRIDLARRIDAFVASEIAADDDGAQQET